MNARTQITLDPATMQILNDGTGSSGTISLGNSITLGGASGSTYNINVGNNGSANTGNTVALGVLSNGTSAVALLSTINFTGANGYVLQFSGLNLPGSTGHLTLAEFFSRLVNPARDSQDETTRLWREALQHLDRLG